MLLELVEPDLADELRADAGLLQLARPPAIRLGEAALGRALEERQDERGDLVVPPGADSRRADVAELAVVVVEPEEARRDPALGLRLPAHADDHAVRGPVRLHLDDALAGAGEIRQPVPLGDHAVEAGRLEPVQPLLRSVSGARDRRELEALAATLELSPPFLERPAPHLVAVPEQEIEGDELRRDLAGEAPDTALRRVEPHLHRVEVEHAVPLDHDLAVQGRVGREELAERPELREVAEERAAVTAPERELAAVVLEHPAEAVPPRLVLPVPRGRKPCDELGPHGREGHVWSGHAAEG